MVRTLTADELATLDALSQGSVGKPISLVLSATSVTVGEALTIRFNTRPGFTSNLFVNGALVESASLHGDVGITEFVCTANEPGQVEIRLESGNLCEYATALFTAPAPHIQMAHTMNLIAGKKGPISWSASLADEYDLVIPQLGFKQTFAAEELPQTAVELMFRRAGDFTLEVHARNQIGTSVATAALIIDAINLTGEVTLSNTPESYGDQFTLCWSFPIATQITIESQHYGVIKSASSQGKQRFYFTRHDTFIVKACDGHGQTKTIQKGV